MDQVKLRRATIAKKLWNGLMNEREITASYQRDGYVAVEDIINDRELAPIREFITGRVDDFAREEHAAGRLASRYEDESFGRRYAAICQEQGIAPRGWGLGSFGRQFYDLYTLPGVLRVLRLILGPEVSNIGSPALRTKLPGSAVTSFPWHQDSQYVDQSQVGVKEKHTGGLHMVTVWVPLVAATVENGCCWVLPGSHRWGLLDGARGEDMNVRMEEDIESRGTPTPVPLEPGSALFMSNLCVHTSKLNTTDECRWSIDYRYFPTPGRAALAADELAAAEFVRDKVIGGKTAPLVVLSEGHVPGWEEWEAEVRALRA